MRIAEDPEAADRVDAAASVIEVGGVTERDPMAGGDGDVDQWIVRRSEVEIDEADRLSVANDHVLDAQIVVADDCPERRGRQVDPIPDGIGRLDETPCGVMQSVLQLADACQEPVVGGPSRKRRKSDVAFDETEDATPEPVGAEDPRSAGESDGFEVFEEAVHRLGERAMRPSNGIANSDHAAAGPHAAGERDLGFGRHLLDVTARDLSPWSDRVWSFGDWIDGLMAIVLALASALVYGVADYCGGKATRRASAFGVTLLGQTVSLALLLVIVPALGDAVPGWHDWAWGAAGGVCGALGLLAFYHALAHGSMTIVAPTTAVVSAVLPVLVGFFEGERPGLVATAGIVVACCAIALVSGASKHPDHNMPRSILLLSIGAGFGFGMIFVALAKTTPTSGLWPLIPARLVSIPTILIAAGVGRQALRVPRKVVLLGVVSGVCDMSANALYIVARRHGLLTVVAVLSAMYPVSTVVLAAGIDKERMTRTQLLGLVLAVAALALVAVGRH